MKVPQAIFTDEETGKTWYRVSKAGGKLLLRALAAQFPMTEFTIHEGYLYIRKTSGSEPNPAIRTKIDMCANFFRTAQRIIDQDYQDGYEDGRADRSAIEIPESLTGLLSDLIRDEVDAVYDELERAVASRDTEEVEAWASKLTDLKQLQKALGGAS